MFKKLKKIILTVLSFQILFMVSLFGQPQKMITITIKDTDGNPISGAVVTIGESIKPLITNDKGEFAFQCLTRTPVLVEAEGFASKLVDVAPAMDLTSIELEKSIFQMSEKDKINVPFGQFYKRQVPAAIAAIDTRDLLKSDQQKSFSGAINGRIPGLFGSTNIRQFGNAMIVVDGIPRPATSFNLEQIEQITIIKDLASAMLYGSQAENGVIYITTRRGKPLKKEMHFTAERGLNKPVALPKYLNSADYMTLYNEALANDGLDPKYSVDQITKTKNGTDPIRYPNEEYYNSTYLKDYSTYNYIVGETSGGNDIAQYYLNLGWARDNSLLKVGEGANEKNDRLNMRGNVNYKLTDHIKLIFDGAAIFNFSLTPRYTVQDNNFWVLSSTLRPDNTPVLIPSSLMKDESLLGAAKLIDGKSLLGGTSQYQTNLYGELTRNGPRISNDRLIEINAGLNFNLENITPGLSASGFLTFNMYNLFLADIINSYAVYRPNYAADTIASWSKYGTDIKVERQTLSDVYFYRRNGAFGTIDYNRIFNDKHNVTINSVAYRDEYSVEGATQLTKHLHFGLRANYMYDNKYIIELTGVNTGSVKLFETNPWAFSPGIGLAWIISEENFLKNNSLIDFLKVRSNWGVINTDENLSGYYLSRNLYTASGTYYYNQTTNSNTGRLITLGNSNVSFEKKMNFNLGFESMLFDYKVGVEGGYFYYKNYDVLTRRSNELPAYIITPPFENYGSYQTQGVEFGLNYSEKIGDLEIKFGSNLTYSVPKALVVDELPYPELYRRLTGQASDSYFGLVALGLFKDQAEIDASPVQTFGTVKPGDIKYKDLNNDGVIDDKDQQITGNWNARLHYGLNLFLKYKSVEFFALGTGQTGSDRYFNNAYYWIYADRKYSEVVWDRWTPATAETATYPRLTTLGNPNNFRNSTFWLYENKWFTLHTLQLTYLLPKISRIEDARIFLRANNILTISKIKDKTQLNIGSPPQVRVASIGLNISL